ncbi:MAG TPA: LptA/OstA family protein [Myxococcota bacterium]|nr:LptA/OstA family protein [Myxococcota bacterium]
MRGLAALFALALAGAGLASAEPPVEPADGAERDAARVRVGVAPFDVAAAEGVDVPDFATLLADLLGTRGVGRIVGPAQAGIAAGTQVAAPAAKAWAESAEVDGVVVGRTTRLGNRFSVDVRLLSAQSGDVVGTYIAEVAHDDPPSSALGALADQLIAGILALAGDAPPASRGPLAADASLRGFHRAAPISIRSQRLEAAEVNGTRRLVFRGDVNVVQNDITMTSKQLTADYPKGSSDPTRLVAEGAVRVVQGDQEASCDSGTFHRAEERLVCCGHAELRDGASRVRGKCIEFDLARQTVRVEDATVSIAPEPGGAQDDEAR